MGIINGEDIRGYRIGGELVCCDCITNAEDNAITEEDVLTEAEDSEILLFCDRCKKRL